MTGQADSAQCVLLDARPRSGWHGKPIPMFAKPPRRAVSRGHDDEMVYEREADSHRKRSTLQTVLAQPRTACHDGTAACGLGSYRAASVRRSAMLSMAIPMASAV
jgi:hypothetical protein